MCLAVTLKDIANELNLSINTVSRALRDMSDISIDTRNLVKETAKRAGYRKNLAASRLRTKKSHILGVVVTDVSNPAFSGIVKGAEAQGKLAGYTMMLGNTNENALDESAVVTGMLEHGVDGILLVPSMQSNEILTLIHNERVPFVLAIRKFPDIRAESVRNDDIAGASALAEYLYMLGHRRFLYVSGLWHISSTQERYEGFLSYLESKGLSTDALQLIKCDGTRAGTHHAIRDWLGLYDGKELPVTAIFAFNDYMVGSIYLALKEKNIRIPQDISVVGYDNNEYSAVLEPSLTTVDNHFFEIGRKSVARLIDIIGNTDCAAAEKPQEIIIMPELVIRNSAVPPRR